MWWTSFYFAICTLGLTISSKKSAADVTLAPPIRHHFSAMDSCVPVEQLVKSKELSYSLFEVVVSHQGFLLYLYLVNNTRTLKDLQVIVYACLSAQSSTGPTWSLSTLAA